MIKIDRNVIENTVHTHGVENTLSICMEEPAELIQAISKMLRVKTDKVSKNNAINLASSQNFERYLANLIEEMADTLIVIEELKYIFCINDVDLEKWIQQKQERQVKRDDMRPSREN